MHQPVFMKIRKILHPSNWTKLKQVEGQENDDYRRDILFSQILIIGLIISILHFLNDLFNANPAAFIIDFVFIVLLVVFYILNERGAHRLAKFLDLVLLNFLIFLLASILDEKIRMSYNFFPLAILAFLVFYKSEILLSILFSTFSMILLIILEITDYKPFGDIGIKEGVDNVTLIINIFGSYVLLVMGLIFLVKLNLKAENELRKKELDLKKTNEELDRFVYSTSHDLRAPLLSIRGLTNLLKYKSKDVESMDYIEKIDTRIVDLDHFISDIIDYSRNARTEVRKEEINIRKLVETIYDKLKYMIDGAELSIRTNLKSDVITSDPARLNVLLSNIISNSIRYLDTSKSSNWIEISLQSHNENYVLSVEDNGIGIEKEYQGRVFEMFYRANNQSDGSGLGLYIVKEMIEKLKGEIEIASEPGQGTKVTISIPQ